jgi:Bacterial pre-peptidase C-terminal domain/Divergent InlB B-repeat domain
VTVPTSGVNLRVGPGGSGGNYYRTFNQPSAGEAFDAVASAPNTSNLDCSQGWYQIVHTDGSRFDDLADGELPDGWICANFVQQPQTYTLSVLGSGTGTGTVTGSGISCTINNGSTSGTCQASYSSGTNVSLTATPTSGSTFSGWSGSCSGTGACNLTMSSNKSVTAGFAAQGGDVMLNNGVPYNGTLPPGAQQSVWKYFYFDVAAGSNNLVVTLDNLSEDADLYLRFNNKPDLSNYDCRPYINGTSTETCNPSSATAGRWWIGVVNYTAQTTISFRIKAAWTTSGTSTAGSFYTVTPCRLLDTRGGSPLVSGSIYEIAIAGICGIPATAKSISANLTVIDATAGGNLVVWPAQTSKPNTSNISFAAGQTRANNTMLLMAPGYYGSAAAVWLQPSLNGSSSTVHVILDVNGYFQ